MAYNDNGYDRQRQRAAARRRAEQQRQLRNKRIIIVVIALLVVAVFVAFVFGVGNAISSCNKEPVETVATPQETQVEEKSVLDFDIPQIPQAKNLKDAHYSAANGGVYILDKTAYELFGWSEDNADYYVETIDGFAKAHPDMTVYNILVPNHTEFGVPRDIIEDGTVATQVQADNIKYIYSKYKYAKPINIYNALGQHIKEYIYFNTDHHWTGLGSYYAYQAFCEQTDQKVLSLDVCQEKTIKNFTGTLMDYDESLKDNVDTVHWWDLPYETHAKVRTEGSDELEDTTIYYADEGEGSLAYGVFIWGDNPLFIEYNDELQNGKKIAVVKESYGNCFVPYLTADYEEVHIIDFRYFGQSLSDYCKDNGITEVLFINNVMAANTAQQVDKIDEIK